MSRQTPSLREPPTAEALNGFPVEILDQHVDLFRVTRAVNGPWWFACSGEGRFDLECPDGTCYTSLEATSAILEVIGPDMRDGIVSEEFIRQRVLYTLHLSESTRFAMLAHQAAASFGVTREIHTLIPYDLPQAWARRLRQVGFKGLRYSVRHDPAPNADGIALFGQAGEADRPYTAPRQIKNNLLQQLYQKYGIQVAPIPAVNEITFEL